MPLLRLLNLEKALAHRSLQNKSSWWQTNFSK